MSDQYTDMVEAVGGTSALAGCRHLVNGYQVPCPPMCTVQQTIHHLTPTILLSLT